MKSLIIEKQALENMQLNISSIMSVLSDDMETAIKPSITAINRIAENAELQSIASLNYLSKCTQVAQLGIASNRLLMANAAHNYLGALRQAIINSGKCCIPNGGNISSGGASIGPMDYCKDEVEFRDWKITLNLRIIDDLDE